MSQHGRHSGSADVPRRAATPAAGPSAPRRERKLGPVSMETLLVLALICVIAGASVLVNRVDPGRQRTQVIQGQTTNQTTTLGQGGIQPGDIQARTITPVHVAASDELSGVTPAPTPKPLKPPKGKATAAPTAPAAGGTVAAPTGGGSTGTTPVKPAPPASGGGCGLGGLLGACPAQAGPQAGASSPNPPGQ